jgi:hypothetical protein
MTLRQKFALPENPVYWLILGVSMSRKLAGDELVLSDIGVA